MNTSRVPLVVLAAIALAGCGSTTASGGSPPSPTSTSPIVHPSIPPKSFACDARSVRYSVSDGGAAAGNWYTNLIATNISSGPCSLDPVPEVAYVNRAGQRVGPLAVLEPGKAKAELTLKPGERAAAVLHQANPDNFPPADCQVAPTAGYAVALWKADHVVVVPAIGSTCARPKGTTFWASPWTKTFEEMRANP